MKNTRLIYFLLSLFVFVLACATPPPTTTKREAFPKMYEQHPLSILVLPPINQTTAAEAKEYYNTTIAEPLTCAGYYVYPIEVTSDILRAEGIYDTALIINLPPQKFKQYFGADAVLYIKILKWDTAYFITGGNVTVAVDFLLKSTETGEDLWRYNGAVTVNTTGDSGNNGIAGLIAQIISTAILTATTDYVPVAKQANSITLLSIPYGKYHPEFDKDQANQIILQKSEETKENTPGVATPAKDKTTEPSPSPWRRRR